MAWKQPLTVEEKLKALLIPPSLYIKWRARKELRKGEKELHLLPYLVDPDRVALDIGANKGVWTQLLSTLTRQVQAFEPSPKLFTVLSRGLPNNAVAHQLALSDQSGEAELRIPRGKKGYSNQGGSLSTTNIPDNYGAVQVRRARLDDLNITDVGFMKIDVEGHEMALLEGARQTILRDRPILVIELEERHTKKPIETLVETVEGYGYHSYALRNGVLTSVGTIDMERHHRAPKTRSDYIFNFIFLPKP